MKLLLLLLFFPLLTFSQVSVQRISKITSTDPNEISLLVNPANPQHLIACANINYRYYSNDSGKTWAEGYTNSASADHGDPVLAYDSRGNVYRAHLNSSQTAINFEISDDGGINWKTRGGNIGLSGVDIADKPWLDCDVYSNRHHNNLYLAWTEFSGGGFSATQTKIRFSRSLDSGLTWSKPIDIIPFDTSRSNDKDDEMFGTSFAIGDSGEIFLCWPGKYGIQYSCSLDGGSSFSKAKSIASMPNGGLDLSIPGMVRYYSFPTLLYDHSHSLNHGLLYLVWADQRNGSTNTDIFLSTSGDSGIIWSKALKVNTDNSKHHQFMPAATVDSASGLLYICYYDRRNYNDNRTELYLSRSVDGGRSFKDQKLSKRPFSLPASATNSDFIGDYNSIQAIGGQVYASWTEDSLTNRSVWLASRRDTIITDTGKGKVTLLTPTLPPEPFTVLQNFPNPCQDITIISYALPNGASDAELNINELNGKPVLRLLLQKGRGSIDINTKGWAKGAYIYGMRCDGMSSRTMKLIVE